VTVRKGGVTGSTAAEIAASLERAVHRGSLGSGEHLPPVRALAASLKVSPATVAAAYRGLQRRGLVVGDGRRGTTVRPSMELAPRPMAARGHGQVDGVIDLASGNPDPELLPPLLPALRGLDAAPSLYGEPVNLRTLTAFAAAEFEADGVTECDVAIVGGALDGIERVLREHLRPGDRVGLEDPALPALRDLTEASGYLLQPIAVDDEGPSPDGFAAALRQRVRAVIVTPRAQNPTGAAFTAGRAADLRRMLMTHKDVLLVENDAAGPVAGAPFLTLAGSAHAHRVVVRSTSKFLGPDLRLAVIAGDARTIARVQHRQMLGTRWVSHILQQLVLALWSDPASGRQLARASDVYTQRRAALVAALASHGIPATGRSGLNVWISAREEGAVVQALAQRGWAVAGGERFRIKSAAGLRVTTAALRPEDAVRLAADLAAVLRPSPVALA
jgi:DNA-binding transcriptional MocR family regulator